MYYGIIALLLLVQLLTPRMVVDNGRSKRLWLLYTILLILGFSLGLLVATRSTTAGKQCDKEHHGSRHKHIFLTI